MDQREKEELPVLKDFRALLDLKDLLEFQLLVLLDPKDPMVPEELMGVIMFKGPQDPKVSLGQQELMDFLELPVHLVLVDKPDPQE